MAGGPSCCVFGEWKVMVHPLPTFCYEFPNRLQHHDYLPDTFLWITGGFSSCINCLKDYEVRQYVVQVIFSVTLAFSCTMFELIIFEILGVLNSSSRYFHWKMNLCISAICFMVPFTSATLL
uniref:Putative golgi ph regulator n=1 Tax=Ixodes ricinus TaxID=34613 RepID=A0A0K8R5W7_IXORI